MVPTACTCDRMGQSQALIAHSFSRRPHNHRDTHSESRPWMIDIDESGLTTSGDGVLRLTPLLSDETNGEEEEVGLVCVDDLNGWMGADFGWCDDRV